MAGGMKPEAPKTVDEYLAALPKERREVLQGIRSTIRTAAPEAEEYIGYQMPAYRYRGTLVYFGAAKHHYALYGIDGAVLEQFSDEVGPFYASKGTLRFTEERPIPAALVTKLVKAQAAKNEARGGRGR
jgi:uncharacterized protein YdhG (YjbR/CyaY superfamily)